MADIPILVVALAIIVLIILLLTAFMYFGNRERSFEEVYGELFLLVVLICLVRYL